MEALSERRSPASAAVRRSRRVSLTLLCAAAPLAVLLAPLGLSLAGITPILKTVIGLGLVIFFHELGHFAVAKWCDVYVERFSIGFGPVIWSAKRGETEYALSLIPFGGYVKMLGQDDSDPSQMTSEEIAEDPRSYVAKSVPQRMAIISAGVIMNLITAVMFFGTAFFMGMDQFEPVVGHVSPGMPGWEAGIRPGDTIESINGNPVRQFTDVMRGTALSRGLIDVHGRHRGGGSYDVSVAPDTSGTKRLLGLTMADGLELGGAKIPRVWPRSAAAEGMTTAYEGDARITAVDGTPVEDHFALVEAMSERAGEAVELTIRHDGGEDTVRVPPAPFRDLGLRFDIGPIVGVRKGSVAQSEGIRVGDRISKVDGRDVGPDLDPFHLPDVLAARRGEPVSLTIIRDGEGGKKEEVELSVVPGPENPWSTPPSRPDAPLAISSLGVAVRMIPTVLAVTEGGPAAAAGIRPGDTLKRLELSLPEGQESDWLGSKRESIDLGNTGGAYALWAVQRFTSRDVSLALADGDEERVVPISTVPSQDWFLTTDRGLATGPAVFVEKAGSVGQALAMSGRTVRNNATDIYLTLRNLFTGDLSVEELHGPIGIAITAYEVAKIDLPKFLTFLGMLSVNLAVLNFLPIPVLDGGHMVFLIWEGLFRRRPSEKVLIAATWCGFSFVFGLMALVIYLDVKRNLF